MKKIQHHILLLLSLLLTCSVINAQQAPFHEDIQSFKHQDSIQPPPKHAILFVGSSSFTKWKDVQDYFPGRTIINRGFGGSTLTDVIHYADDVIKPYHAKQVVIYCGENDLASSDSVTSMMVVKRFKQLFAIIRGYDAKVPVAFVSLKPSPSRKHLWNKMKAANGMIQSFLASQPATSYIDVYSKMFNPDGTVMKDIFIEDDLHMNAKGYAIWKAAIEPYLVKTTK